MPIGNDTLYGNEWINFQQSYFEINLVEEGIYRVSYEDLAEAGVFAENSTPKGGNFQLFYQGEEIPLFVSTAEDWKSGDYLEFFGTPNKGEIDKYIYEDTTHQLNPGYSLFSDTATYFLSWNAGTDHQRIVNTPNNIQGGLLPADYCWTKTALNYNEAYARGRQYVSSEGWASRFDLAEGFCKSTSANNQSVSINANRPFNGGPEAQASIRLFVEGGNHQLNVSFNGSNYIDDSFNDWAVKEYKLNIPSSQLNNGANEFQIEGLASEIDKFRLVSVTLNYPHDFNFENRAYFDFELNGRDDSDHYLEISNFDHGNTPPVLYDLTNRLRIITSLEGGIVKVTLPASPKPRHLILISQSKYLKPRSLFKQNFVEYDFENDQYDYIILSHRALFNDGNGNNLVKEYADYRSSSVGGGYKTLIVDVVQLYNQFGYGIPRHEIAIRNFLALAAKHWQSRFLLILGKGVDHVFSRKNYNSWRQFDFVPSFGQPHSDYLFVTPNSAGVPTMAVGRVAAKNTADIRLYLDKVKEFESTRNLPQTIEDRAWMKRALHFGGGDANIQNFIANGLNELKGILESSQHGGKVISFFKNSTDVIQSGQTEEVKRQIDKGSGLLSFFGHSAPNALDFDVGDPQEYNNKGKYPLFFAIGCNTNRMFEKATTLSEDFVFIKDKGAIGFFGTTWLTTLGNVNNYGRTFYNNFGNKNYGRTIGEIIQQTNIEFSARPGFLSQQIRHTYMLHGDPALKIYTSEQPDYIVNVGKSFTTPGVIDLQADSFALQLTLNNLGRAVNDSITLLIEQETPGGERFELRKEKVLAPFYETQYHLSLPILDKEMLGKNILHITVDAENNVTEAPEAAELNNQSSISFVAIENDIRPVFPYEFSIVNTDKLVLKASTTNPFSFSNEYIFEIDTTERFDSPLKLSESVQQVGGTLEWAPSIPLIDQTVYYWRVRIKTDVISENWNNSSFLYQKENFVAEGWNQSHFWQRTKSQAINFTRDSSSYQTAFRASDFSFKHVHAAVNVLPYNEIVLFREGFRLFNYFPCSDHNDHRTVWILAYDPTTLTLSQPPPGTPSFNCFGGVGYGMIRKPNIAAERAEMMDFIENQIPDGSYVYFITTQTTQNNYHADEWAADSVAFGRNLFQVLEKYGVTNIRDIETQQTPYFSIFKKNDPTFPPMEFHAETVNSIIDTTYRLKGVSDHGSLLSPPIGPSTSWQSLQWQVSGREDHDEVSIDLYGITPDEQEVLLHEGIQAFDTTLTDIDARQYPYLRMRWNSRDTVNRTSPQLDYWRVLYDPLPEAALAPNLQFSFHADTLDQGEPLHLEVAIANIGGVDMDSLLVKYTVTDAANVEQISRVRMAPLVKEGQLIARFDLDTRHLRGDNQLTIEANPENDQPEQFHFNNIGIREFYVEADRKNPLMDVTFDGIHIMNGDIVSAKPNIMVTLKDENRYLALSDTGLFRVRVLYPDGQIRNFAIDNNILTFYPADSTKLEQKNEAQLEFKPVFEQDGTYQLIVQGRDQSGNASGEYEYRVGFEVINKQMVSNVLNYPNPFSTATQFVFTLTGDQVPDFMKIQIMTPSGRIVREITQDELGPLHVGNNMTEFRWDGTDEYGDRLANGVYLYRVITRKTDGELYESFDTGTDQYFKSGIGKMVIMR